MAETIYFNGKKYNSVAEMPADERKLYEKINRLYSDENRDGIPDVFQGKGFSGLKESFSIAKELSQMSSTTPDLALKQFAIVSETDYGITINGKSFRNVAELPPDLQQIYQEATQQAENGRPNIYDESWREAERDNFFKPHDDEAFHHPSYPQTAAPEPTIETIDSNNRLLAMIVVTLLLIGFLISAWVIFF
ncbi:MAG TPA: hypothetical protein DEH25_09570 [Chloroflexi bacterium]|nr:hypothetical protein [Chloroflexota bacterium]